MHANKPAYMCEMQVAYSSQPHRDRNKEKERERYDKSREKEKMRGGFCARAIEKGKCREEKHTKHAAFVAELIHASGNNKAETS